MRKFLIQTPSFAASEAAMYSASVVESATVSCLELFQLTAPPFSTTQILIVTLNHLCRFETSIGVTCYNELLLTSIDEEHIFSPSQVLKNVFHRCPVTLTWIRLVSACHT